MQEESNLQSTHAGSSRKGLRPFVPHYPLNADVNDAIEMLREAW